VTMGREDTAVSFFTSSVDAPKSPFVDFYVSPNRLEADPAEANVFW